MEKSKYFTENNLPKKSDEMLHKLSNKIGLHSDILNISKSALLILDMQRFFHDENSHAFIPSASAIIKPILKLADSFYKNDRPVILTQHINTLENAKMMDFWWHDIITEDSPFSEIIDEIIEISKTQIIQKSQYDAFYNTNLNELLEYYEIEQIVITGVMTHLCCETTARSAFVHGYNVFFPIDGTATYNVDMHSSSLMTLAHGFANITIISKIIETINE